MEESRHCVSSHLTCVSHLSKPLRKNIANQMVCQGVSDPVWTKINDSFRRNASVAPIVNDEVDNIVNGPLNKYVKCFILFVFLLVVCMVVLIALDIVK